MRPHDTSVQAHERQLAIYRAMTTDQRLALALAMSEAARQTTLAGIRARHPEYDEATAVRALLCLLHGPDLHARVWPGLPAPAP